MIVRKTRREIAALRPSEDGNDRFSTASNELDAIIVSTERASSEILTSSERILEMIGKLRDGGEDAEALHSKIEAEVRQGWNHDPASASLSWEQARQPIRDGWHAAEQMSEENR